MDNLAEIKQALDGHFVRADVAAAHMEATVRGLESLRDSVGIVNESLKATMGGLADNQILLTDRINKLIAAFAVQMAAFVIALVVYIVKTR